MGKTGEGAYAGTPADERSENRVVLGHGMLSHGSVDLVVRGGQDESWGHGEEMVGFQPDAAFRSGGHKVGRRISSGGRDLLTNYLGLGETWP